MFAIRNLLRTNTQFAKNVVQPRNMSGIGVPARNKVSKAEVLVHAALLATGWLTIPIWVLTHIKQYRDRA